jgi:hypothetical protein
MSDNKIREPWYLSDDNDGEEWGITDGVEFYPLHIASQTEIGLAVQGTIERANAAALAATPQPEVSAEDVAAFLDPLIGIPLSTRLVLADELLARFTIAPKE